MKLKFKLQPDLAPQQDFFRKHMLKGKIAGPNIFKIAPWEPV